MRSESPLPPSHPELASGGRPRGATQGTVPACADPAHPAAQHVAIIMDGNGRWAAARGLPRVRGHERGVESVRAVMRHASALGLAQLTLFVFSTENWRRPPTEVGFLMDLLAHYLVEERAEMKKNDVRVVSIGETSGLPSHVQEALCATEATTAGNSGMVLCLALNYGGRTEIARAARRLAQDALAGRLDPATLENGAAEAEFARRLYQPEMPPLDLLIRTSGENRLSNFLLWQMSYAEIHVTDKQWPEFREADLDGALEDYASRSRRFGGLVQG